MISPTVPAQVSGPEQDKDPVRGNAPISDNVQVAVNYPVQDSGPISENFQVVVNYPVQDSALAQVSGHRLRSDLPPRYHVR